MTAPIPVLSDNLDKRRWEIKKEGRVVAWVRYDQGFERLKAMLAFHGMEQVEVKQEAP